MKITIESTEKIVQVNGVPARIWEGATESGIPCFCMVTRIGVSVDEDASQFERELKECKQPTFTQSVPLRMILD